MIHLGKHMLMKTTSQFGFRHAVTLCIDHSPSLRDHVRLRLLEDLILVPGNVDYVHLWLLRSKSEQGSSGECVHGNACLVPGNVEAGDADTAVLGDAVEQSAVESAES